MKNASFQAKTSSSQQSQSVANNAISLAPPEYGIDFADRQAEEAITELPSSPIIQTKLAISPPDDEYEQEADRVAETVMRCPISVVENEIEKKKKNEEETVMRCPEERKKCDEKTVMRTPLPFLKDAIEEKKKGKEESVQTTPLKEQFTPFIPPRQQKSSPETDTKVQRMPKNAPYRDQAMERAAQYAVNHKASGKSIEPMLRSRLKANMGADLSNVRVHTDSTSQSAAFKLHARAFTHGQDIWLGSGESQSDVQLMAHETAHVIQQDSAIHRLDKQSEQQRTGSTPSSTHPPVKGQADEEKRKEGEEEFVVSDEKESRAAPKFDKEGKPVKVEKDESTEVIQAPTGFETVKPEDNPVVKTVDTINPSEAIQLPAQVQEPSEEVDNEGEKETEKDETLQEVPGMKKLEETAAGEGEEGPPGELAEEEEKTEEQIMAETSHTEMAFYSVMALNLLADKVLMKKPSLTNIQGISEDEVSADPKMQQRIDDELESRQTADTAMANSFLSEAAGQLNYLVSAGFNIWPRLQFAADEAKALIRVSVQEQHIAVNEEINKLKSQSRASAGAAKATVAGQFQQTVNKIKKETADSRGKITTEYDIALANINKYENDQIPKIDKAYSEGSKKINDGAVRVGNKAYSDQNERAASLMVGYKNEDDSFLDGPYTYNKQKAKSGAAKAVGEGYKKGIIEEGEKQAQNLLNSEGKVNDRKNVKINADKARESLARHYEASLQSLEKGQEQALKQAHKTRDSMMNSIQKTLKSTLSLLDKQGEAQVEMLTAFADRQEAAIDRDMLKGIAALEGGVNSAASQILNAIQQFKNQTHDREAPDPIILRNTIDTLSGQLNTSVVNVMLNLEQGISVSEQGILTGGNSVVEGLGAMAQKGITEAREIAAGLPPIMTNMTSGADRAFTQIAKNHTKNAKNTTDESIKGIKAIDKGTKLVFEQMDKNLQKGLEGNAKKVEKALQDSVSQNMLSKSLEEEKKAASKVAPRWKKVLKVLLVVAVIVVVALVVGPAVIGFVAGAAASVIGAGAAATAIGAIVGGAIVGAAAGAVIQMGNNVIDGAPVMEGVGKAAIVGAIGGALGGAGGALGQLLTKGAAGLVPALSRFGVDMAFDIGGGVLGDLAVGNPITIEGIVLGAAIGAGVSISMGGLAALKGTKLDIGGFATKATDVQTKFQTKGEAFGAAAGSKGKARIKTPEIPSVKVEAPAPPKVETPSVPKAEAPTPPKAETPTVPKAETPTPPKGETPIPPKPEAPAAPKTEKPKPVTAEEPSAPKSKAEKDNVLENTKTKKGEDLTIDEIKTELDAENKPVVKRSANSEFDLEVELPNGHKWKKRKNGKWCRFSSEFCHVGDDFPPDIKKWLEENDALLKAQADDSPDTPAEIKKAEQDAKKQAPGTSGHDRIIDTPFNELKDLPDICFPSGTLVKTKNGNIPIEKIRKDDSVYSFNFNSLETELQKVTAVFKTTPNHLYYIHLNNETLKTTGKHPFWVENRKRWIETKNLKPRMKLRTINGQLQEIISIDAKEELNNTYNFTVRSNHNYFVGDEGILVHNSGKRESSYAGTERTAMQYYRIFDHKEGKYIYVGKTEKSIGIKKRFKQHKGEVDKFPWKNILSEVHDGRPRCEIELIGEAEHTKLEQAITERFHIEKNGGLANLKNIDPVISEGSYNAHKHRFSGACV